MRSIQGTAVTMGSVIPSLQEALDRPYRRRGNPGWRDNDPSTWKTPLEAEPAPAVSAAEASHERRQRRLREYEALMKAEPGLSYAEAARVMGLTPKTVRSLARELDPTGYQVSDQAAEKQQRMRRFRDALAADPDPGRPNVAVASRAAGISPTTGYAYWKQLRDEQAAAAGREAGS